MTGVAHNRAAPMHASPDRTRATAPLRAFRHTLRVYWEDTDAGGIVFYANYLKFFERARTEWLRALGFSAACCATTASYSSCRHRVRYLRPARLDDCSTSPCRVRDAAELRCSSAQQAWRGARTLVEGASASAGSHGRPALQTLPHSRGDTRARPDMNQDLSILTLVLHASFVVQLVMAG